MRALAAAGGLLWLLAAVVVLSGASALAYQVVWFRVLGLVFGVTAHATSAVLAAFMAGLALGSLAAGRFVDQLRSPLRAYGVVEALIGLAGLASLSAFDLLQPLYRWLAANITDSLLALSVIRFALAFAIMLVPTTLMGATLPLVVKASLRGRTGARSFSRSVSVLYAANTLGAIAGAFSAGFYLIGLWGTGGTTSIAAAANLLVGAVCLALGRARGREGAGIDVGGQRSPAGHGGTTSLDEATLPHPRTVATVIVLTYAVSGGIALAYEVVWTRVLSVVFPQTVYAFAIMLCWILAGISAGSWLINTVITRRANWVLVFAALEALMGISAALSVTVLSRVYGAEAVLRRLLATEDLLTGELWFISLVACATIFPTALLMGAAFPVSAKLYGAGHPDVGRRLGVINGANVLGGIAGALLAGLVLIPTLGSQRATWLLASGNVVLALVVLAVSSAPRGRAAKLALGGAAVGLLAAAAGLTPDMYHRLFASHPRGEQVVWYEEGEDATIKVVRTDRGNLLLYVNSQGQASDAGSGLLFHRALGHLPALLHPWPEEALVVGLGGGATAGAVALHTGLNVTVAELHGGVVRAARLFTHANLGVLDRPNVRVTLADGRNHLLLAGRRYDLIQGDIIPPGNAGAANLYSADYYRLARARLKPGGLMVQWVDSALPEYQWKLLIRTFLSVFPDATLWGLNASIIVGSDRPLRLDAAQIEARLRTLDPRARLDEIQMGSVEDVLKQFVATPDELHAFVGRGPIITDRHPSIEYTRTLPGGARADYTRFSRDARPLLVQH